MNTTTKRRILIVGAGAIGGYIGGSLHLAGHSVVFFATPQTRTALAQEGLDLVLPDGSHHIEPQVVDNAAGAFRHGEYDLAVFAVKRFDTESAAGPLQPYADRIRLFLNLQNGVGAEGALQETLSGAPMLPGTVTTAVARPARSRIVVERLRGIGLAGRGPAVADWTAVLDAAGLNARSYPDPEAMKWSKLMTNLIANPVSAILDASPLQIFGDPKLFRLEILQLREALAVMDALGLPVIDLPGTPARLLAFCVRRLPLALARMVLAPALTGSRGDKMPSFHVDLHSGRGRSEIDFYHGAVVEYGRRLGVPTPVNALLLDTMQALLRGSVPLDHYRGRPDRLLKALEVRLESGPTPG